MQDLKKGLLFVFEGIDGSGKTTVVTRLYEALKKQFKVIVSKEPGGTILGKQIRAMVQEQHLKLSSEAEFLLFAADRAEHMTKIIRPALQTATIILCDRMADSSIAYQGYGRGLPIETLESINRWILKEVIPTKIFYLSIDYQLAQARVAQRGIVTDFDTEKSEFFERVISGYERIYEYRDDVYRCDARKNADELFFDIYASIMEIIHEAT